MTIKMTPFQLKQIAGALETDAQSLKSEMDAVNTIIQFLRTTEIAPRLEMIYADWDQAYQTNFVNWEKVVRGFANHLQVTANNMIIAQQE